MDEKTDAQRRADFEALYERRFVEVTRYVRRRIDPAAADDAVAEVFLVAWRRFYDIPTTAERPWLLATARKVLANGYRSRQRREALVERLSTDTTTTAADPTDAVLDRLRVRGTLASLSAADQEVLRLAAWERLPPGKMATVLGCSNAAAKVRLHRARRRFAVALAAAPPLPAISPDSIEVHP
ncbi:MAG: RNA polymerase sigma factor [Jatrophihabitans sp.]